MSNIRGVHVLAEFPCPRCGGPSVHISIATLSADHRLVDPVEHAGGRCICNACTTKEREAENAEHEKRRAQRAWAKKHPKLTTNPKGPRKPKPGAPA